MAKFVVEFVGGEEKTVENAAVVQFRDGFVVFLQPGADNYTPIQYAVRQSAVHSLELQE